MYRSNLPQDPVEKGLYFGCGTLLGGMLVFLIALKTGLGWTRGHTIGVVLGALACGLLSIRYGHHFLELLLRLFRRW